MPAITVGQSWNVFPGHLFGLKQPGMRGLLTIAAPDDGDLDAIDKSMSASIGDLLFEPPAKGGAEGMATRVAALATAFQTFCGIPLPPTWHISPVAERQDGDASFHVAIPFYDAKATRLAVQWVVGCYNRLLASSGRSTGNFGLDSFRKAEAELRTYGLPSRNLQHFIQAAYALDIPAQWAISTIFAFGTGRHTRLLDSTVTERTSQMGARIARNKAHTAGFLRRAGLPAPLQHVVTTSQEGVAAAAKLGYPVVVKPIDKDQGAGVFAGLRTPEQVNTAVVEARKLSDKTIVEKHFHGHDYRLTVVDGQVLKIEQRIAAGVIGDGAATIGALVQAQQASDRMQRIQRETGKMLIAADDEALDMLSELGLRLDSVIEAGRYVPLRRKNNVSTGGEQVLIPAEAAHPDNIALAIRAAGQLRLDFAGVDLIIPDIARSWLDSGALICEVNAVPQVGVRTTPNIYGEILRTLIGPESRVPAHLLIVADEARQGPEELADLMTELSCTGLATTKGIWIDGARLPAKSPDSFLAARILLAEPAATSALCVMPLADVARKGLPADWFETIRLAIPATQAGALIDAIRPHCGALIEARFDA